MTTAQMVAEVRTKLDEAAAGLWTDTEIYRALNNGQIMTASKLHAQKKFGFLNELYSSKVALISDLTLPTDYWQYIDSAVDNKPCLLRTGDKFNKEGNYYLTGDDDQRYIYLNGSSIYFNLVFTGYYWLNYYKKPTEVAVSVNSILDDRIHPSLVQYAFADLLLKDEKHEQSALEFQKYNQMVAEL